MHISEENAGQSMFAGFETRFPRSDDTKQEALKQGHIVLDANILLNLYRMTDDTMQAWERALHAVKERIWVPHQVLEEFWRVRETAGAHPTDAKERRKYIRKASGEIKEQYRKWKWQRGDEISDEDTHYHALDAAVTGLLGEVQNAIDEHEARFSAYPREDAVVKLLSPLLDGRVGAEPSEEQLTEYKAEADQRFPKQSGPGWQDSPQSGKATKPKEGDLQYGDFFIWRETIDHLKQLNEQGTRRSHIVFVTSDGSSDWYKDVLTSDGEENVKIAQPELVEEMRQETGARLILMHAAEFLNHANQGYVLGVSEKAIQGTRAASQDTQATGEFFTTPFKLTANVGQARDEVATVYLGRDLKTIRVEGGSLIRNPDTQSIPVDVKELFERLESEGQLGDVDPGTKRAELLVDLNFKSPTAAYRFIMGTPAVQLYRFVSEDNETLREFTDRQRSTDDDSDDD